MRIRQLLTVVCSVLVLVVVAERATAYYSVIISRLIGSQEQTYFSTGWVVSSCTITDPVATLQRETHYYDVFGEVRCPNGGAPQSFDYQYVSHTVGGQCNQADHCVPEFLPAVTWTANGVHHWEQRTYRSVLVHLLDGQGNPLPGYCVPLSDDIASATITRRWHTDACPECGMSYRTECAAADGVWDENGCSCYWTPIILDLGTRGLALTDVDGGVVFDATGRSTKSRVSWTQPGVSDAFLALDRDGNGQIDSGKELFGGATDQPPAPERNGFKALAMFDEREHGGNADGWITPADAVFHRLVLWTDRNHNGVGEPREIRGLRSDGVRAIGLAYSESTARDRHGNLLRYHSRVVTREGSRAAVDVFLMMRKE